MTGITLARSSGLRLYLKAIGGVQRFQKMHFSIFTYDMQNLSGFRIFLRNGKILSGSGDIKKRAS